jgi:hypothetical protein
LADALTIGTAISVAGSARRVLGSSSVDGRVNAVSLDRQLSPPAFAEVRVLLGGADAKTAISISILAGNGILGALRALRSEAALAGHESLVSNLTDLTIGGTRISRLNLHGDTSRAIALIDRLVGQSEYAGANFISSTSPNIKIRTTRFGGTLDVAPQPLDSIGLNLAGINLLSEERAADALARIDTAIYQAGQRVDALRSLQRTISFTEFSDQALSALINGTSGSPLPVGTLVNLFG